MRRLNDIALNAATGLVTIAALVMVGIRTREHFFPTPSGPSKPRLVTEWRSFAKGGRRIGPSTAVVTVVEFTDFQCPFCRRAAEDLQEIHRRFPNQFAIVFRHFPLTKHEFAASAARAAECAARQGRFEAYHDLLFSSQDSIGRRTWTSLAGESGVPDTGSFETCMSDPAIATRIKEDVAAGEKLGVTGTPTLLVNDLEISGYPGKGKLAELVESALEAEAGKATR